MRYHIVGIAGAGMSAIAHILLDQGHTVSGSDIQQNTLTAALEQRGALIHHEHDPALVANADRVVATSAVRDDHIELVEARKRGIPTLRRADLWREWSCERRVVAVAGTHGKTTTTALIALMLVQAGVNPGFLIGGETPDLGTNARWGDPTAPLVVEADEYDRTFLALTPDVAVITNVEWEHVDIYPSADVYESAFRAFAERVMHPQRLIVCGDDPGALRVASHPDVQQYGIEESIARNPASCRLALMDWMAANVRYDGAMTHFDLWRYDRRTYGTRLEGMYTMRLVGDHNVRNALAAIAAAMTLGVDRTAIAAALAAYRGARRRFDVRGEVNGILVVDDYAHHPTEVRATLAAARVRFPDRRIVVYLQPHTFSRIYAMLDVWAHAFDAADVVRIGDVYPARETGDPHMAARMLADRVVHRDVQVAGNVEMATAMIAALLRPGDVLLTLGAGDGHRVGELALMALSRV
ncbi:UDP-N-acetylmuramate--L-alanine ligase [Roseiflexus sp.]|uniref:UDP-N-acetylmuramate--L-alanine ligase n=1 Tax=Roseiflexus sp. TaxID=2562120 RepID=UPI00398B9992